MGFEIGNHTYSHKKLSDLPKEKQYEEIVSVNHLVEEITGERPKFFRAPFGINTDYSMKVAEEEGLLVMNWSFGYDWNKLISEKGVYKDGTTLKDHLSPELYEKLEQKMNQYGIQIGMISTFEPWYVNILLDGLQIQSLGYDEKLGVDYYFLEKAENKEVIELEGIEYQLNMFDSFSENVQLKLLELSLDYEGDLRQEMEELIEVWKMGDEKQMIEIMMEDGDKSKEYDIYINALLDERNAGMTEKITQFLTEGSGETYFVIVGAAHYVGEKGIIKLLENQGFEVENLFSK